MHCLSLRLLQLFFQGDLVKTKIPICADQLSLYYSSLGDTMCIHIMRQNTTRPHCSVFVYLGCQRPWHICFSPMSIRETFSELISLKHITLNLYSALGGDDNFKTLLLFTHDTLSPKQEALLSVECVRKPVYVGAISKVQLSPHCSPNARKLNIYNTNLSWWNIQLAPKKFG